MFYQSSTACVSKTNQTSNRNFPTWFSGERCQEDMAMFITIISWVRRDWVWLPGFNIETAVLTGATCLVSNSNNISGRASPIMKARQILKRDKRHRPVPVCCFARFASCDVKGRQVASGNKVSCLWQQHHFSVKIWWPNFVAPYSTDNRSIESSRLKLTGNELLD